MSTPHVWPIVLILFFLLYLFFLLCLIRYGHCHYWIAVCIHEHVYSCCVSASWVFRNSVIISLIFRREKIKINLGHTPGIWLDTEVFELLCLFSTVHIYEKSVGKLDFEAYSANEASVPDWLAVQMTSTVMVTCPC